MREVEDSGTLRQKKQTNKQTYLTFVKEAAHDVALQQVRVLGHAVDVSHRVVQVEHVLRRLLAPLDVRGFLHPKDLQEPLDGCGADFRRVVLAEESVERVGRRRPRRGRAAKRGQEADDERQHLRASKGVDS